MTNNLPQLGFVEELSNGSLCEKSLGASFGSSTTACEDIGDFYGDDATALEALESDWDEKIDHRPVWESSQAASCLRRVFSCQNESAEAPVAEVSEHGTRSAKPFMNMIPSVGSEMHASGTCRPCSFFWQSAGCQKGLECNHCHLCPKGVYQRGKKLKIALRQRLRATSSSQQYLLPPGLGVELPEAHVDQPTILLPATSIALHTSPALFLAQPASIECSHAGSSSCETEKPRHEASSSAELVLAETEAKLAAYGHVSSDNSSVPSIGSELHRAGLCKPCAWFWKPESCKNGTDCRHCHSCLPGEAKYRKTLKLKTAKTDPRGLGAQKAEPRVPQLHVQENMWQLHDAMTCLPFLSPSELQWQGEGQQEALGSLLTTHEQQALILMRQQHEISSLQLQIEAIQLQTLTSSHLRW